MSSRVYGLILAAGMSRRLGRPKQLLELDGKPLVAHVVEKALAADLDGVVVVIGSHASEVELELRGYPVFQVFNPHFAQGQGSTLAAGIRAMPSTVGAAVVLLADMPGVRADGISAVVARWRTERSPAVIAGYGSGRGHPALFDREVFPQLRELESDTGGRDVLRSLGDRVAEVRLEDDAPPDVDTEEDWQRLQAGWRTEP